MNWVSVQEELPPFYKLVECIGARGGKFKGRRTTNSFDGVTLWMQTPDDVWGRECTHWRIL